jgi:hypothetical protein
MNHHWGFVDDDMCFHYTTATAQVIHRPLRRVFPAEVEYLSSARERQHDGQRKQPLESSILYAIVQEASTAASLPFKTFP